MQILLRQLALPETFADTLPSFRYQTGSIGSRYNAVRTFSIDMVAPV